MTVGERLRFIRKVRGMPQHELASKVKLSANRIAQYETDYRVPRKELLQQLAMVLGVDPRFFIATAPNDLTDVIRLLFRLLSWRAKTQMVQVWEFIYEPIYIFAI